MEGDPFLREFIFKKLVYSFHDKAAGGVVNSGQKDRDAFHGFAGPGTPNKAAAPAARFARLALPDSPCRQAWRCYALFALPPPSFHA